jgi:hypothetical protein
MSKSMTRRRIEQYGHLQSEITMLAADISSAETGGELVTDYAKDYSTGYPKAITLRGYGSKSIPRLLARKSEYETECESVELFIEELDDSIMRQLLTRRYIEGKTLKETGRLVGYSDKQASRLIENFFEKMSANVR